MLKDYIAGLAQHRQFELVLKLIGLALPRWDHYAAKSPLTYQDLVAGLWHTINRACYNIRLTLSGRARIQALRMLNSRRRLGNGFGISGLLGGAKIPDLFSCISTSGSLLPPYRIKTGHCL